MGGSIRRAPREVKETLHSVGGRLCVSLVCPACPRRALRLLIAPMPLRRIRLQLGLVILAAAGLYLIGNDSVPLWDRDEPRYAQTSAQMLQSGDWIVPRLLDEPREKKPVFIYWCQATAMRIVREPVIRRAIFVRGLRYPDAGRSRERALANDRPAPASGRRSSSPRAA